MAKKINMEVLPENELQGEAIEKTENAALQPETGHAAGGPRETDTESFAGTWSGMGTTETPGPKIMQVLRAYPGYESLYVDRQGGAFPPDTAALIRKDAILYKNPFYEPLKSRR